MKIISVSMPIPDIQMWEQMKLVNAVLVKQSMFDRGVTEPGDTIGSIMSGIEAGEEKEAEKFLAQISNVVPCMN